MKSNRLNEPPVVVAVKMCFFTSENRIYKRNPLCSVGVKPLRYIPHPLESIYTNRLASNRLLLDCRHISKQKKMKNQSSIYPTPPVASCENSERESQSQQRLFVKYISLCDTRPQAADIVHACHRPRNAEELIV